MSDFLKNPRWIKGPDFLLCHENTWPEDKHQPVPTSTLEVKKEVFLTKPETPTKIDEFLNSFSDWTRTLRKVAWMFKFIDWIKSRVGKEIPTATSYHKRITSDDLRRARNGIILMIQRREFPEERKSLEEGKPVKAQSNILKLKPFLDEEDLLRVGGRISQAPISMEAKNPIILPKQHHITSVN